jgi:hypothetical protein
MKPKTDYPIRLRLCSLAARGLWWEISRYLKLGDPPGYLRFKSDGPYAVLNEEIRGICDLFPGLTGEITSANFRSNIRKLSRKTSQKIPRKVRALARLIDAPASEQQVGYRLFELWKAEILLIDEGWICAPKTNGYRQGERRRLK